MNRDDADSPGDTADPGLAHSQAGGPTDEGRVPSAWGAVQPGPGAGPDSTTGDDQGPSEDRDALLEAVDRLKKAELEKREEQFPSEAFLLRAREVEEKAREVFRLAADDRSTSRKPAPDREPGAARRRDDPEPSG